jgi:holo-[acyl-carrier protein] synthase
MQGAAEFAGVGGGCFPHWPHHTMILGIGIDIAETARVKGSIERFGDDFLKRILLPEEIAYCMAHKEPALYVAARFAAKEAISKAFGTGVGAELGWCDMEICRKETGEPFVVLHGGGKKLFEARGAKSLHITLTHTGNYAAAVAILEG